MNTLRALRSMETLLKHYVDNFWYSAFSLDFAIQNSSAQTVNNNF